MSLQETCCESLHLLFSFGKTTLTAKKRKRDVKALDLQIDIIAFISIMPMHISLHLVSLLPKENMYKKLKKPTKTEKNGFQRKKEKEINEGKKENR